MPIYRGNAASEDYADQAVQTVANDLAADIAALNNGSTYTTVGVGGATPTATTNPLAVEGDASTFEAGTDDFVLNVFRATATDVARISMGESGAIKATFGLEGGNDLVGTLSSDGISYTTWLTVDISQTGCLPRLASFAVASLPSAATYTQCLIYVSDGTANKRLAISDGTNWRFPDGNVVS